MNVEIFKKLLVGNIFIFNYKFLNKTTNLINTFYC